MAKPQIVSVELDEGKLRHGPANKIVDKDGFPIISRGFLTGNNISPSDWNHPYTFKFKISITSTSGKRNWLGRIVAPVFLADGSFLKWEFVVVCTKNEADPGQETDSINITVTNPDGQSDPLPATVPSNEIP
jgi:hypothetical protein